MMASCEECETQEGLIFCTGCNDYFCKKHWDKPRKHRTNELGPGGIPHEPVEPKIAELVRECMAEPVDPHDQNQQHQEDEDTTWFGLDRDDGGDPILAEYRRYAALMMESAEDTGGERCPALVSFIGQTGAGKSSLIRLLINPYAYSDANSSRAIPAPIVGRSNCEVPTSADVHLYADPATVTGNRPILFADCEGFDGGEKDPVAYTAVPSGQSFETRDRHSMNAFQKLARGTKRALKWANKDNPDHDKTSKRGYAVSQMYPRIFYAFSDVVVFVVTNARILEDVVEKLLDWADANCTKSTNLPTKPHAIIALNKSDHLTTEDQWNPLSATANLLKSTSAQINKNSTFKKYADIWKSANHRIRDMEDLLRCYYSTVNVVRFPDKSRFQLMHDQREKLYDAISKCCEDTREVKRERKMLADADEFGLYLSLAFDHFSESLDEPFDYVTASLRYQPPPESLRDNLQTFVRMVSKQRSGCPIGQLFAEVTPFVASCLLLDSSRKQRIGQASDWFQHSRPPRPATPSMVQDENIKTKTKGPAEDSYEDICRKIILWYMDNYVPCEYLVPSRGLTGKTRPCIQTKKAHGYEHKTKESFGASSAHGPFTTSVTRETLAWPKRILENMKDLESEHQWHDSNKPRQVRAAAHSHALSEFYQHIRPQGFFSNSICLACLANIPEHFLPCGHMLCTECVLDFGILDEKKQLVLEKCPLHPTSVGRPSSADRCVIHLDPPFSGKRVLCLDGGGVRGIVEICVLQAIQERIGVGLQNFFDLVVGTSTGGIIALAFGDSMWPLDSCSETFINLVKQAFTLRHGSELQVVKQIQFLVKRSKYKTSPLASALTKSFGLGPMLRAKTPEKPNRLKVAVTATSSSGSRAYVLSNYNAKQRGVSSDQSLQYTRYRSFDRRDEIKIWEAARCTSAAPGYFKPYSKPDTQTIFPELMDGGVLHNNPIQVALEESQRLAGTAYQMPDPDILLSVGTGLAKTKTTVDAITDMTIEHVQRKVGWMQKAFSTVQYQIQLNVNTERRYNQVYRENTDLVKRMFRINPDLGEQPPPFDDTLQVQRLKNTTKGWLTDGKAKRDIDKVACVLVASSFYFERTGSTSLSSTSFLRLSGVIKCRLSDQPEAVKGLGRFLDSCGSRLSLIVENHPPDHAREKQQFQVPVRAMVDNGVWTDMEVRISVPGEDTTTSLVFDMYGLCSSRRFPLSGFPRNLIKNDYGPRQMWDVNWRASSSSSP